MQDTLRCPNTLTACPSPHVCDHHCAGATHWCRDCEMRFLEKRTEAKFSEEQRFSLEWSRDQLRGTQSAVRVRAARVMTAASKLGSGSRDPFVHEVEALFKIAESMDAPLKRLEAL